MLTALLQQGIPVADSSPADSIAVSSPLPSPALMVVRFLFNTVPQSVQIGGVIVGAIVAIVIAVLAWRNRIALRNWFTAKSKGWKLGFAAITLVILGGVGFAGTWSWNYMMHTNEFCSGCHIMAVPFQRFGTSEHAKLQCHDCHRQSIFASAKELYIQVTERPDSIPSHRGVPNAICSECHVQRDPDSTWQRISETAGHQVHLNPRSPVMSKIECITCHGKEVHRFKPVTETCAQSGCHDDVRVELGKMAQQTDLHCVMCHDFTVRSPEGNPVDSSRARLTPGDQQCLGCHAMRERLGELSPEQEPHGGKCGSCHNPHAQTTPSGAFQSCATAGCHARSDTLTAMHRNLGNHRLTTCGACHGAHTWKADAVDCRACHTGIRDPAVRTRPPDHPAVNSSGSPHSGIDAMPPGRGVDRVTPAPHSTGKPLTLTPAAFPGGGFSLQALQGQSPTPQRDTARFEHARHERLNCTTCHETRTGHGTLKRSVALDCQGCHHASNATGRTCATCHTTSEIAPARPVAMSFALSVSPAPQTRTIPFAHDRHGTVACADCHDDTRTRAVQRTCESCHSNHHTANATCASCHPPARDTHVRALHLTGCGTSGCHVQERGPAVNPVRATCLACHGEQREHMPGRECAACHLSAWVAAGGGS